MGSLTVDAYHECRGRVACCPISLYYRPIIRRLLVQSVGGKIWAIDRVAERSAGLLHNHNVPEEKGRSVQLPQVTSRHWAKRSRYAAGRSCTKGEEKPKVDRTRFSKQENHDRGHIPPHPLTKATPLPPPQL